MRRLVVAAAVSLASASEPFSWADAQNAMHSCTNASRPLVDKYAYLSTRHPLGNALSGWMHVFMYALASGRQPVVGSGTAPRLLCGREGAFSCGVPFVSDARTLLVRRERGMPDHRRPARRDRQPGRDPPPRPLLRGLVESRRDADRATATYTETPARARAA